MKIPPSLDAALPDAIQRFGALGYDEVWPAMYAAALILQALVEKCGVEFIENLLNEEKV